MLEQGSQCELPTPAYTAEQPVLTASAGHHLYRLSSATMLPTWQSALAILAKTPSMCCVSDALSQVPQSITVHKVKPSSSAPTLEDPGKDLVLGITYTQRAPMIQFHLIYNYMLLKK